MICDLDSSNFFNFEEQQNYANYQNFVPASEPNFNDIIEIKNDNILFESLNTKSTVDTLKIIKTQIDNNEESEIKEKKTYVGKKRNNTNFKGIHNKYSGDNVIRKISTIFINNLIKFINDLIYEVYKGKINQGILKKELKKMDKSQTKNLKENKEFLYKKLSDIFSVNISNKYTNFSSFHNKDLINELLNEKDEEKKIKFKNIFNLTFLDCINHYNGKKYNKDIEGLTSLINEDFENYESDQDYFELLKYYTYNLEEIIMRKKIRKGRKHL